MSENRILENLDRPEVLEYAYRSAPDTFESELKEAIGKKGNSETLRVWHARLNYMPPVVVQKMPVSVLVLLCLLAGLFIKLPSFFSIDGDWYYPRFAPLITIAAIIAYFCKTAGVTRIHLIAITGLIGCVAYTLVLPDRAASASITMALIHIPLFLLSLLGLSFMSDKWGSVDCRLDFIRYIGEMGIYAVLIVLGGIVLTVMTLSLFNLIGLSIEEWYTEYIVVLGLVSSPLVATYLYDSIQRRQSKFASVLSDVFSPLFLITILAYLMAALYQGKSVFTDRDFLIDFNGLLLVILALTIFSIAGKRRFASIQPSDYVNVLLVCATLLVNVVALSAILSRWAEHGITVNRVVVTGANVLIFVHLILILVQYARRLMKNEGIERLESAVAMYLPVYTLWSLIVSIVIPLAFEFE